MVTIPRRARLAVAIALGSLSTVPSPPRAVAAASNPWEGCPWPTSLDAVAAAPKNHRVLLENERVRVLDVTVAPGERQPVHAHCWPSVMHIMYEGVSRNYDAEGRLIDELKVAPPTSEFPKTIWLQPTPPHSVHNLDSKPIRLLRVELKP
jgi:hypothetical protein